MPANRSNAELINHSYSEISDDFCKYQASDDTVPEGGYVENTDYKKTGNDVVFIQPNVGGETRERSFRYVCAQTSGTIEVTNRRGQKVQMRLVEGVPRSCISSTIGSNTNVDVIVYF